MNFNENVSSNSNNIFSQYIQKETIFRNKNVLTSAFIPSKIMHRDAEIEQISSILAPALRGYQPSNIFIYGTCGTGKTICAKFVMDQLNEISSKTDKNLVTVYVNSKMKRIADTEYRLFAYMLRSFGEFVPDTGLPTDVIYRRFFDKIDSKEQSVLIVLDEIDALFKKIGDEFLYNLTRAGNELEKANISVIGITNDISFRDNLDSRVKSSLSEEEIFFKPYNALQLKDILQERVRDGLNDSAVSEEVLGKCAAIAAQEHGDARRALDLIRVAGEIAERNAENLITEKHLDAAEEKIDFERVIETVRNQPSQSQAVLYSILKMSSKKDDNKKWIDKRCLTGDVFDIYSKMCKDTGLKSLTQRRVSDLINELDMLGIINAKVISKGRYGRTREISVPVSDNVLSKLNNLLLERFGV